MIYRRFLRPLLFTLSPETVHHVALDFLAHPFLYRLLPASPATRGPALEKKIWNLTFPNPIGLAAGFDKNAVALRGWERLGFGFMELGTVTRHAQPGNPAPRLFRLPGEHGLINRLGFPNEGAVAVARRLTQTRELGQWPSVPVGMNLGKSKITPLEDAAQDYRASFRLLRELADYFVINVSSPNTPGLRTLQGRDQLERIVGAVQEENQRGTTRPLLIKVAPDLTESQLDEVLEVISTQRCNGIVATNTTLDKSAVTLPEEGGLSGRPLQSKSTEMIRLIAQKTGGQLPIIGVGGIFTAQDAWGKLQAGATLLQAYTGFIYEGPNFVPNLCRGLAGKNTVEPKGLGSCRGLAGRQQAKQAGG